MTMELKAWSYSRYADYAQCPLRFKLKHLDRIPTPGSAAMDRGSAVHKEGEAYLAAPRAARKTPDSYQFFDDQLKDLRKKKPMVEQQWGFTKEWQPATAKPGDAHGWFAKDTWLRIVTDVCYVEGDTANVIDFKTGRKYETNHEQMDLFSCGPFMKFPDVKFVNTHLWYLDQPKDNIVTQHFTRQDFGRIKKEWERRIRPMFNDRKFPPKPNNKCRWCSFSKEAGGPCRF